MNPFLLLFVFILCGIIGGLLTYLILETKKKKKDQTNIYFTSCYGTRWGCCPDGITPKYDPTGSNCRKPCMSKNKDMLFSCNS